MENPLASIGCQGPSSFGFRFLLSTLSAAFLGILTSLAVIVFFILCQKGFGEKVNIGMFIAIVTMYIISLMHLAATIRPNLPLDEVLMSITSHRIFIGFQDSRGWSQYMEGSAALINVTLSDLIVMWRARLIWDRSRRVLAFSALLFLATVAIGIWSTKTTGGISSRGYTVISSTYKILTEGAPGVTSPATLVLSVLSLVSNLSAFVLVAWKAWSHRRLAKQSPNCEAFHGNVVGRTLALLLECGAVYSLLWALYVAVVVKGLPTRVLTFGKLDEYARSEALTRINSSLTEIIVYVAATYPSAILLIAALQRSVYSDASRFGGLPRAGAIGPPTKKCLADLLEELSGDEHAAEPQPEASMESVIDISSEFHPTPTTFLETANPLRNST